MVVLISGTKGLLSVSRSMCYYELLASPDKCESLFLNLRVVLFSVCLPTALWHVPLCTEGYLLVHAVALLRVVCW